MNKQNTVMGHDLCNIWAWQIASISYKLRPVGWTQEGRQTNKQA